MKLISGDLLSRAITEFNQEKARSGIAGVPPVVPTEQEARSGIAGVPPVVPTEQEVKEFQEDEPILGFGQINETLDDAEEKYTSLITGTVFNQVNQWWKLITPALDSLDEKEIDKYPLNLTTGIQGVLLAGWREIFSTGSRDGIAEVNEVGLKEKAKSPKGLFNDCHSLLVEFSNPGRGATASIYGLGSAASNSDRFHHLSEFAAIDRSGVDKFIKRKPAFEVAYPPDQADLDVLDIDELREALNLRTQVLADDLSQEVSDKIARVIKESVDLHVVQGQEVQRLPLAARTKIRNRIDGIIGYERQKQKAQGVAEKDLPRDAIPIPGKTDALGNQVVVRRAKMIASTELNAGYNLGRLQSYYRAGVKSVRWQAIGDNRTCQICTSRNGTVLPIEEVLKSGIAQAKSSSRGNKYRNWDYIIPAHPFCRCAWQVATEEEIKDPLRGAAKVGSAIPLAKAWKVAGSAASLAAGIGTAKGIVDTAQKITREQELQQKARARAKNRAATAVAGALSLGLLSFGLWSWLNRSSVPTKSEKYEPALKIADGITAIASEEAQRQSIASALIKSQGELAAARQKRELELTNLPLTPEMLMRGRDLNRLGWNTTKQKQYAAFINSGINLKTITDTELRTRFQLLPQDIAVVRGLARQHQRDLVKLSPYQKLLPASAISPIWLGRYPWLADVSDLRELGIKEMLRRGIPEPDALQIYNRIYQQTRSAAGISQVSKEERSLLAKINSITTKEELAGLLQLTRNQGKIVNSLFAKLQRYKAEGREIKSVAELRLRGIGDQTVARMLAETKGKLRINEVLISSDRVLGLARLKTIAGVGDKTAQAIYETLLSTGVQFLDAADMIDRIEPYLKQKGLALSPRVKQALSNRIDFTYYPGLDRQTLPPGNDFPALPGFTRRGDLPGSPSSPGTSQEKSSNLVAQTPRLVGTLDRKLLPAGKDIKAETSLAINEVFASKDNLIATMGTEIRQSKANPLSRENLGRQLLKTEQKVSRVLQQDVVGYRTEQRLEAASVIENIDTSITNLAADIEASITNSLTTNAYSPQGRLSYSYRNRINQNIRQVEIAISKIKAGQKLSRQQQNELVNLEKQLTKLKQQTIKAEVGIKNNPVSVTNLNKEKVIKNSENLIQELENIPKANLPADYPLKTNIDLLKATQQELEAIPNPVAEEIDEMLEQLKQAKESNTNNSSSVDSVEKSLDAQLNRTKQKLIELRDRSLDEQELEVNRQTIKQRQAITQQNQRLGGKVRRFEKDYSEYEQEVNSSLSAVNKQIAMVDPNTLAINQKLLVDQAQVQINQRIQAIDKNQRDLDLLKSDRWQQYATSVVNLEDMAKGNTLSANYLSLAELVTKRNEKLNQAAGAIKRNAQEMSAWSENPRNVLSGMLASTDEALVQLKSLEAKQNKLRARAEQVAELGDESLLAKSIRYQQQLADQIAQLEQAKNNLQQTIAQDYQLNLGTQNKARTPEKIKDLASKAITRSEKRLIHKDRATVTQILDRVDKAGLNTSDFITAAKQGVYSPQQQVLINSLNEREKRSLNKAVSKQVLELNQDLRVMKDAGDLLNSLKKNLVSENQKLKAQIIKLVPVRGVKGVKLLDELQSALDKNDTIKAKAIAIKIPAPLNKKILLKIEKIAENLGDSSRVSTSEVNILSGVRPSDLDRQEFLNLVKGNKALDNAYLYDLAEIEQAIALNQVGLKATGDRLSAVNFADQLTLQEF